MVKDLFVILAFAAGCVAIFYAPAALASAAFLAIAIFSRN